MQRPPLGSSANSNMASPKQMLGMSQNRNSTLVQGGKGLLTTADASPVPGLNISSSLSASQKNTPLRASANSQINGQRRKYGYHSSKPHVQTEKIGEYVTKEARNAMAQQIKSAHFQLSYSTTNNNTGRQMSGIEEEVNRQKWNPQQPLVKNNYQQNNFQLGTSKNYNNVSQNRNDFPNHGASFDPHAKAKRLALVNELRRSNLPSQNYDIPKSSAQEQFGQSRQTKEEELQAIKQRKEDANKIFNRNRGVKPNFSLGAHRLDYLSENKGSMTQPIEYVYDKSAMDQQVASQRKHNFKMSFEQGNQFETAKGSSTPYKLPGSNAMKDRVVKKGASNVHQVQLGNNRSKSDYKSLTALQQNGYKAEGEASTSRKGATYSEVREKIAQQTKDLRSSHFALGADNSTNQASSAAMFTAPPTNILINGGAEGRQAKERIQKSNFSLKDIHGSSQPVTTQSQAMNRIRQGQWDSGQIVGAITVPKPPDSINFGQACAYTSEAKSTFVGKVPRGFQTDPIRIKEKQTKPNINFGSAPRKDTMLTVAQANEISITQTQSREQMGAINSRQKALSKEFSREMRVANFKMGSILPEHNSYKPSQIDRNSSGSIGLTKSKISYQPTRPIAGSQKVSSGNNIAMGQGQFKTVNQEFTNWIQPSAIQN